jgi:chromosome segregation ATPase
LQEDLETYTSKLTGIRQEIEQLATKLNELLNKQDDLQALAKEEKDANLNTALEEIEKMTAKFLEAIDAMNDTRNPGRELQEQGEELLKMSRSGEGKVEKVRDGISKVIDCAIWLKQGLDPIDAFIEYGSDCAGKAAEALGNYKASKK